MAMSCQEKNLRARQLAHRFALGGADANEDWVFPDEWGQLLPPYRVSEAFRRLVRRAGLAPLRFHDLRHTAATLMLQAGVPIKIVQTRLGHATAALTLDVYAHVTTEGQREGAEAVDALLADAR